MRTQPLTRACLLALAALATPAAVPAQSAGGLGALLGGGGGVPSLAGVGAGNAAGMLSYCVKNQLLGNGTAASGTGGLLGRFAGVRPTPTPTPVATPSATAQSTAQSVLGRLLGRKDVAQSPGFAAGQAGQLQLGNSRTLPVTGLGDQIKSRVCSAVLSRATAFL